ncbi:MAG: DUF502 domain-containing protein [Myxococcales bacterium]|nr:MAG: DUF502 domain-containing protein [Myxococcales bacterium]
MTRAKKERPSRFASAQQYILAGLLTIVPLWVTWLVFSFLFGLLSKYGTPVANAVGRYVSPGSPFTFLLHPWFRSAIAILWILTVLYVLGWAATRAIGARLLGYVDAITSRIPFVQTIYGAAKKLVGALQTKPDDVQRVVLLEFPSPGLRAVGFVTRTFKDAVTGQPLAAVYVPTTPNPTSGYLEIVPLDKVVSTDWSMDDALAFIMSGGAVAPGTLSLTARDHPLAPGVGGRGHAGKDELTPANRQASGQPKE